MKNIVVICIRVCLGLVFFSSGMEGLFTHQSFPELTSQLFRQFNASWYGMDIYGRYVSFIQLITGFLLLTNRFATLGALLLFPMILNIIMVTIALDPGSNVWPLLIMLAFNIVLLLADYQRLKFLFTDETIALKRIDTARSFPFHDLVFLIGMFIVSISPFLASLHFLLGWLAILIGFVICIGIQYFEVDLKQMLKQQQEDNL